MPIATNPILASPYQAHPIRPYQSLPYRTCRYQTLRRHTGRTSPHLSRPRVSLPHRPSRSYRRCRTVRCLAGPVRAEPIRPCSYLALRFPSIPPAPCRPDRVLRVPPYQTGRASPYHDAPRPADQCRTQTYRPCRTQRRRTSPAGPAKPSDTGDSCHAVPSRANPIPAATAAYLPCPACHALPERTGQARRCLSQPLLAAPCRRCPTRTLLPQTALPAMPCST